MFTFGQALASDASSSADSIARARQEFDRARLRFDSETNSVEAAWRFGRACFDLADATRSRTERAQVAGQGIDACRRALARDPGCAQAHYYLGMDLGELADTRRNLGGLRLVKEMESEFQKARALDEHFDHGGADRNLGLLYLEAPSFVSIGNRTKARQHLQRSIELAPDYPENRLHLVEAFLKWGDMDEAQRQLRALEKIWDAAHGKLSGPEWGASWRDWEQRFKAAQRKLQEKSKALESPHQQK